MNIRKFCLESAQDAQNAVEECRVGKGDRDALCRTKGVKFERKTSSWGASTKLLACADTSNQTRPPSVWRYRLPIHHAFHFVGLWVYAGFGARLFSDSEEQTHTRRARSVQCWVALNCETYREPNCLSKLRLSHEIDQQKVSSEWIATRLSLGALREQRRWKDNLCYYGFTMAKAWWLETRQFAHRIKC